jgi:hypothetical protein
MNNSIASPKLVDEITSRKNNFNTTNKTLSKKRLNIIPRVSKCQKLHCIHINQQKPFDPFQKKTSRLLENSGGLEENENP